MPKCGVFENSHSTIFVQKNRFFWRLRKSLVFSRQTPVLENLLLVLVVVIVIQGNKRYITSLLTICDPNMWVSRFIIWITIFVSRPIVSYRNVENIAQTRPMFPITTL